MIANVQHWTELIAKRLSGNIREDETRMLDAWVARDPEHQEYFEHLMQVWSVTRQVDADIELPEADWTSLEKRIQAPSGTSMPKISLPQFSVPKLPIRRVAAVAAVLLFGILSVTLIFRNQHKSEIILADAGNLSVKEIALPDGSKVVLRQGSLLRYEKDFEVRDVTLTGEGYFDVTHDEQRPFSVHAGNGIIRVLGTKFNVKAMRNTPIELFVKEGRVAFAPGNRKYDAKIFSEGQAGILAESLSAEVERTSSPGQNVTSWFTGKLVFDHATLDHVLTDLSRHFSIPMVADSALYACELKADFENATLDNILETLRFSLNLQIDRSGDQYVISGNPCATDFEN